MLVEAGLVFAVDPAVVGSVVVVGLVVVVDSVVVEVFQVDLGESGLLPRIPVGDHLGEQVDRSPIP